MSGTIRPATAHDTDAIIDIWLRASRTGHPFIPYDFWLSRAEDMERIYLPGSTTHILETGGQIVAFVSLVGTHLAALFVHPDHQGSGHGRRLLDFAKAGHPRLSLCAYLRNERALRFYRNAGFRVLEERLEPMAREPEAFMQWERE